MSGFHTQVTADEYAAVNYIRSTVMTFIFETREEAREFGDLALKEEEVSKVSIRVATTKLSPIYAENLVPVVTVSRAIHALQDALQSERWN